MKENPDSRSVKLLEHLGPERSPRNIYRLDLDSNDLYRTLS